MNPTATVLIPTFNHGPTLRYALDSALAQSVEAIEVFVVGDGISDEGRSIANEYAGADKRVRFFDNPKGDRHGELLRHHALLEARGEVVCYLSDDDLWFDDHVERLADLLSDADFANTLGVFVDAAGNACPRVFDLTLECTRKMIFGGENGMPITAVGHRLDAYRRLPHGWHAAPLGVFTDVYMWQQFLRQPWLRLASGGTPTTMHLASALPERGAASSVERCAELDGWYRLLGDPVAARKLRATLLDRVAHESAWRDVRIVNLEEELGGLRKVRAWMVRHPRIMQFLRPLLRPLLGAG